MIGRRRVLARGAGAGLALAGAALLPGARGFAQGALKPLRAVCSAPGLSFSGVYIAKAKDLWAKNGLDMNLKMVQGGPLALAALISNEADVACTTSSDPLVAWDKGIKMTVIASFTQGLAMQMAARNDWMQKVGITPKATIDQKLNALKGSRVGVATIGGGPTQFLKHGVSLYGMDGDKDMKMLAVGLGATRIAAMRENQVDVIVGSAPDADQVTLQGFGELYIDFATEVPSFRDFPYTIMMMKAELAEKDPDLARRAARSVAQANDFIIANTQETIDILVKEFPRIEAEAIRRTITRDKGTFTPGARMTESMWVNAAKIAETMKAVKTVPSMKEGTLWTNKFIG